MGSVSLSKLDVEEGHFGEVEDDFLEVGEGGFAVGEGEVFLIIGKVRVRCLVRS